LARVLRGSVYWADFGVAQGHEQAGVRPVLVLSHDEFSERSHTAIVAAITSSPQQAGFPLTVALQSLAMPKPSWVKVSQIRTIATSRLGRCIGQLSKTEVDRVVEGLREIVEQRRPGAIIGRSGRMICPHLVCSRSPACSSSGER